MGVVRARDGHTASATLKVTSLAWWNLACIGCNYSARHSHWSTQVCHGGLALLVAVALTLGALEATETAANPRKGRTKSFIVAMG